MALNLSALLRDALDEGAELLAGKALLVAAPALLGAVAGAFLAVAGYGALSDAFGPRAAALGCAAFFGMLSLAALLTLRAQGMRRRRAAREARARLAGELAALRAMAGARDVIGPLAALVAAFALARRS